jgi:hypothetical protein
MHVRENQGTRERRNEETVFLFVQMILLSVQDAASVKDHYAFARFVQGVGSRRSL